MGFRTGTSPAWSGRDGNAASVFGVKVPQPAPITNAVIVIRRPTVVNHPEGSSAGNSRIYSSRYARTTASARSSGPPRPVESHRSYPRRSPFRLKPPARPRSPGGGYTMGRTGWADRRRADRGPRASQFGALAAVPQGRVGAIHSAWPESTCATKLGWCRTGATAARQDGAWTQSATTTLQSQLCAIGFLL